MPAPPIWRGPAAALAMLGDEQAPEGLGAMRGVAIAFRGRDDRALHQDVPRAGEGLGIVETGLIGQGSDQRPDICEVADARPPQLVLRRHLEQDVDERTALELSAAEPAVEHVEDREQPLLRRRATFAGAGFDPVPSPELLAPLQEREHELV